MEDFDKLRWGAFDHENRDFPEEATERMNEQRFAREYTVYKMGDLVNKIITLDKKFELPFNSILHVLDNVSYPDNYQDAPRVDENEFIQRESGKKFIYHIRELDTTGPIVYPDKFILRFAGLPTTLMKFRQQQGSNFRYLNKIEEFPTNNLYLIVINHNPLFRMRMYGRLPYFRIMQQILASVFNTCDKLKYQHRHQFILLPWSSEVYDKSLFIRSRKELTPSTVRKPNSFHYIFMMHLVNFLWEKETTSMLEKLDDETLAQINLILKHNDKYLIFNLKTVKDFNAKNIIYYRFVNQLNLLALMGSEEAEKHQDTINQLIEENKSETENTTFEIKSPEDKTELDEVHQDTVINKLVSVIKPKKEIAPVRAAAAIKTYVPQPKEVMREVKPSGEQVVRRVAIVNKIANVSTISTKETKDTYAEEYVKDLDTETNDFIDNDEDLTPAAKQHFKKLAAKYKECKVDGVYISKLLLDHSDIGLEKEVLDEKVVGFAPDKSALESSTDTFEKSYREKTFKKHFAGVISSFQNKGVFLTDVKQEVVADPLNNYTLYTCSYEDIHSKKSTIKIKIPNIDSNDRFIADGNPMVIKKQRCALPIIKINDHEVALASNYNKTRVVRNTIKAHSFTGYVESFVNNKDKSTASIIFGSLDINEPISYEYCMMAKRFNEITFTNKDKFVLVFDYYHRLNHVKPSQVSPEKVEKLENNYGTFFGYNTNDIFFIDNTNQVFAVNKKNFSEDVNFPCTSLLDLLKLSLRDGVEVKKALSEFLTIKILNAELPVMIMLAYRYGLRRMLDYIGIEYYITENRSKTIVSESTPATESFGVNSDRVAGSDELEILYGKDWIKPRNDSKPNIVITNRRAEQDETDYEILQNDRNKNDLTYSLPGVEDLKIKWFKSYGTCKSAITWQHLNSAELIALCQDPNPEYLESEKDLRSYVKQIIKKYDKGDLFPYYDTSWFAEVTRKYHLTSEDSEIDNKFDGRGNNFCCSGNVVYSWEFMFAGLPDAFSENYIKAMRECAFGKIFINCQLDNMIKAIKAGRKIPKKYIEMKYFSVIMHERGHAYTPYNVYAKDVENGIVDIEKQEIYANMYAIPLIRAKLKELGLPTVLIASQNPALQQAREAGKSSNTKGLATNLIVSWPEKIDVGVGLEKFNKYITDGFDTKVANYPDISKFINKDVYVKKINNKLGLIDSLVDSITRSTVFESIKSVFGLEGLDRPVKPRLGKIHFYITVTSTGDELNPNSVRIRGMLIEVKLGQSHAVMRRVLNYDGITFRTQDPQKLSKSILEKASDYLHCTEHKIKSADITVIPNAAPLPQDVAKARPMTAEEYAKVTSKLNNEETRVGGNESFDEPMISSEKRYEPKPNDIHIKFADRVLHFNRYPLDKSLIVAGLDAYDLTGYSMADFEGKDAYFSLFAENGLAVNYLKGIDSFYDLFVDNMTYTVLKQMHEPTNVRDLLLRCGVLLSTIDHREASSGANHRIRGYEQFNAILYNEMSREFAGYQARRSKNNAFSINPKAVYLRIVQNESTMPAEASNPLEDIKMYSNITYGGIGGRTGESFVTNDRRFAADDIGVLSEATADSGKVGMNAMLSFDPTVVNTLGVCESKDPHTLKPANVMSIQSLCMPFANTDDPPRVNFNSIQSSHLMGTEYVNKNRVRTGYERVVAHRVSDDFAAVAEKDGKVTKIDHEAKLMEVTYNDGTKNVFRIDDQYEYAESIVIQQNLVTNFKVGDKFKKQDVLTYNKNFFTRDNFTGQADYTTGVMTNVAFIETDTTLEDSTEISEALSKKLAIDPVNPKVITLSAKSKIYKALSIGDKVEVSTPLMVFEEDPVGDDNGLTVDESTVELLGDLNRATPTAGYSGEIVHIDAYYGGSISNMNPSVAKLVNAAIAEVNAASKLASGSMRANEFIKSTQVPIGSKFKGIEFDEDTVMFIYYIKERIPHSTGDKLVLCNQLKATTAAIFPKPVQTESGVPIDMFFSQRGVNARKCLSPFLTGIISRIIEKTEKNIIKDYFG